MVHYLSPFYTKLNIDFIDCHVVVQHCIKKEEKWLRKEAAYFLEIIYNIKFQNTALNDTNTSPTSEGCRIPR
jgi:hypothetical protein